MQTTIENPGELAPSCGSPWSWRKTVPLRTKKSRFNLKFRNFKNQFERNRDRLVKVIRLLYAISYGFTKEYRNMRPPGPFFNGF